MKIIKGNIFDSPTQTIVNTVNCKGVMGKGLALEFRLRYPEMFRLYKEHCDSGLIDIGKLWIYKTSDKWILNFPTKYDWKLDSKKEYLELGLKKFLDTFENKKIYSISFPILGSQNGNIKEDIALEIMKKYLDKLPIEVLVFKNKKSIIDKQVIQFEDFIQKGCFKDLKKSEHKKISIIKNALDENQIFSFSDIYNLKGIGDTFFAELYSQFEIRIKEGLD